jgi:hypothetical protein
MDGQSGVRLLRIFESRAENTRRHVLALMRHRKLRSRYDIPVPDRENAEKGIELSVAIKLLLTTVSSVTALLAFLETVQIGEDHTSVALWPVTPSINMA